MNLESLGWNDFFQTHLSGLEEKGLTPARVIRHVKKMYWIHNGISQQKAMLAGKFFQKAESVLDLAAVGDWVGIKGKPGDDQVMIREVLPRKSQFIRKVVLENTKPQVIAANIDTVFIVSGLDRDFNFRRIERYLTLGFDSGARPVIILNKADLCDDMDSIIREVESIAAGVDILAVSAKSKEGIGLLDPYFPPGQTIAFIGSSGVGKSTLLNLLMGSELMEVQEVRENDQRGRHTTTHRELFTLPNGAMIIDTPGLRELQMWGSEDILTDSFSDIDALTGSCRFSDCGHDQEPGCAVKMAVEKGEIDEDRYLNFIKLKKELVHLDGRQNEFARNEIKRKQKVLSKKIKRYYKDGMGTKN